MTEREYFQAMLTANEDDVPTRLFYADWLDANGEHEEADRQRRWPAAKEWLLRFSQKNNEAPEGEEAYELFISYEDLLEFGREAMREADDKYVVFSCGNNMTMCDALRNNSREFWQNWSIVTGIPLPPDMEEKSHFSCAC